MNDQRDLKEELANAMIPFEENGKRVLPTGWNIDSLMNALHFDELTIEQDADGEIVIHTGLVEAPDRSLWRLDDND